MHRQRSGCTDRLSDPNMKDNCSVTVFRISSYQRRPYAPVAPDDLPSLYVVQNPGHNTAPVGRNAVQEGQPATARQKSATSIWAHFAECVSSAGAINVALALSNITCLNASPLVWSSPTHNST